MFGRKLRKQREAYAARHNRGVDEDRATFEKYIGGDGPDFMAELGDTVRYEVDTDSKETMRLAMSVIRYAEDGKTFEDLYDDLRRANVHNPYSGNATADVGTFMRGHSMTFGELVALTLVVTEKAGIVNFHQPEMLEHLEEFEGDKVQHVYFGWEPVSDYQEERLQRVYGDRPTRDVYFVR